MRRKFHGGSTRDDSRREIVPRMRESRFMLSFFASKRISLTSPLRRLFDEFPFLQAEEKRKRRRRREEMTF